MIVALNDLEKWLLLQHYAKSERFQRMARDKWYAGAPEEDRQFLPPFDPDKDANVLAVWRIIHDKVKLGFGPMTSLEIRAAIEQSAVGSDMAANDVAIQGFLGDLDGVSEATLQLGRGKDLFRRFLYAVRVVAPMSKMDSANFTPEQYLKAHNDLSRAINLDNTEENGGRDVFAPLDATELLEGYPVPSPAVIDDLLRIDEVGALIAPAKKGKTWFVAGLAIDVCLGNKAFGKFATKASNVLVVDNELSPNTISPRLAAICKAKSIDPATLKGKLRYMAVKGVHSDVENTIAEIRARVQPGEVGLVIMDSLYGFYPDGFNENDNAHMTKLVGQLQQLSRYLKAAVLVVHHTCKGDQTNKAVVDSSAGAGSLGRAVDTMIVLKDHARPTGVIVESVARSFASTDYFCMEFMFPLWQPRPGWELVYRKASKDANEKELNKLPVDKGGSYDGAPTPPEQDDKFTPVEFARIFVTDLPVESILIAAVAAEEGMSEREIRVALSSAVATKLIHRWKGTDGRKVYYANRPQPEGELVA